MHVPGLWEEIGNYSPCNKDIIRGAISCVTSQAPYFSSHLVMSYLFFWYFVTAIIRKYCVFVAFQLLSHQYGCYDHSKIR